MLTSLPARMKTLATLKPMTPQKVWTGKGIEDRPSLPRFPAAPRKGADNGPRKGSDNIREEPPRIRRGHHPFSIPDGQHGDAGEHYVQQVEGHLADGLHLGLLIRRARGPSHQDGIALEGRDVIADLVADHGRGGPPPRPGLRFRPGQAPQSGESRGAALLLGEKTIAKAAGGRHGRGKPPGREARPLPPGSRSNAWRIPAEGSPL